MHTQVLNVRNCKIYFSTDCKQILSVHVYSDNNSSLFYYYSHFSQTSQDIMWICWLKKVRVHSMGRGWERILASNLISRTAWHSAKCNKTHPAHMIMVWRLFRRHHFRILTLMYGRGIHSSKNFNCCNPAALQRVLKSITHPPLDKKGKGGSMQPGKRSNHQKTAFMEILQWK